MVIPCIVHILSSFFMLCFLALLLPFFSCLIVFFNISICGSHWSIVFILINKLVVLPSLWLSLSCLSFILMVVTFVGSPHWLGLCCLLFILMVVIFVVSPHCWNLLGLVSNILYWLVVIFFLSCTR